MNEITIEISSLSTLIHLCQQRIEKMFVYYFPTSQNTTELQKAMNYAISNGGKRMRPLLVYAIGYCLGTPFALLDIPATTVEMIHAYSLIHDDLPAMDDADLRRGKPSCHKVFGEGMAVLAGDTLQTLAFHILATHPANLSANQRLNMISALTYASGLNGMAAGQALDILSPTHLPHAQLLELYQLKTGALILACAKMSLIAKDIVQPKEREAIENFAEKIGLAFQIQDDILDIEASTEQLGKPQGIDAKNQKITYPLLLGIDNAKKMVEQLFLEALQYLDYLGEKAWILRELARYILQRNH